MRALVLKWWMAFAWTGRRRLPQLFFLLGCAVFSRAGAASAQTITNIHQFQSLNRTTTRGLPLRLRGIVVCYDAGWHQLYLHDGHETAYFNADDFSMQPEVGQRIEISGTALGEGLATNLSLTVSGKAELPRAKKLSLSQLATEHGEWIETTGRVLSGENSRNRLALLLHDQGQNGVVYVLGSSVTNDFRSLLDCEVTVRGINASKTNHGGLETAMIFAPGMSEVVTRSVSRPRMSQLPVVSINSLLNREVASSAKDWVHINGLVVSYRPGQSMVIKDPTGVIRSRIAQLTEMHGDEHVDAWGFPDISGDEIFLNHAYFEVVGTPLMVAPGLSAPRGSGTSKTPAPLARITDILKLTRDEAARGLPVRIRGILTYTDPEWRNGFIQNKDGAIYVDLDPNQSNLRPGQWVELTGHTGPGGFAPEVLSSQIEVLGETNMPAPVRVDLEDLADGHLDAHWVEMDGVVRRVDELSGHVSLQLTTPKGRFKVIIPNYGEKALPLQLIDALVSVQGACTAELNVRRQLSGITLRVPSLAQVRILEPPPADPFSIETSPIAAVATFDPNRLAGRRVKLQGVVTLRMPGQGFMIQDPSGGLRIFSRDTNQVQLGDAVEVLGFPAIGDFSPFLEESAFRRMGKAALPAAKPTSAEQVLLRGADDAQLISIQARLLQGVPRSRNPQLVLQDGSIIFTAHLAAQSPRTETPPLESGTLLRLKGVCSIQGGERHEPRSFRLDLRGPEDLKILQVAPWWTARHAFALAGGLMLAVTASLAWIALLRRRVRKQTALIRQKLEHEAALEQRYQELFENANDMLYTHDDGGRITSINQTGERLLQCSRAEILRGNILDFVIDEQKAAARQWLDNVFKGTSPPTVEWDFAAVSGQRLTLEISTRLIEKNGRLVEVEGIARDITERKRLEREILEISNREQRRLGHDLHDGVCQQLAGIAFMSSNLAEELEETGLAQSTQAERISSLLNDVVSQTRSVARGLFPVRLEEHGLVSALGELAENASEVFKIHCRLTSDSPPAEVENGVALHLYYIVLEAVANASKHGGAKNVLIRIEPAGDRYLLRVEDDGAGFLPSDQPRGGMGIGIMRYRARVIGATLTLQSSPGNGTAINCLFLPAPSDTPLEERPGNRQEMADAPSSRI